MTPAQEASLQYNTTGDAPIRREKLILLVVGVTSTGFVGTDEMSAVTSFQPCHIFGDQMLIGAGIRIGFYLLCKSNSCRRLSVVPNLKGNG
jgi:hypothetical protein